MSDAVIIAIASVISGLIGTVAAVLTSRSASKASTEVARTQTRGQVEEEAFARAKEFYTDTIDRQARELHDAEKEISELRGRVGSCEVQVGNLRNEVTHHRRVAQRLARAVYELQQSLGAKAPRDPAIDEVVVEILGDDPSGT